MTIFPSLLNSRRYGRSCRFLSLHKSSQFMITAYGMSSEASKDLTGVQGRILAPPSLVASGVPPDVEDGILLPGRKPCTFPREVGSSAIAASNHFVRRAGCPALRQAGGSPLRGQCRDSPGCRDSGGGSDCLVAEAHPQMSRQQSEGDDEELAHDEPNEPFERSLRETVGVQADFEHVHAKPRPARDNVANDGAVDQATLADHPAPAQVQDKRVPKHDDEGAVLLRVPTPEAAPRLVCPDATQHRTDKAE